MTKFAFILTCAASLTACAASPVGRISGPASPPTAQADEPGWQAIATPGDADRLAALPEHWERALTAARLRHAGAVAAEDALLDPVGALDHPAPSPGSYRCRVIRFGEPAGRDAPAYRSYRPFFCYIGSSGDDGMRMSFAKQTGSERPGGWLYPDGTRRLVFLGTDRGGLDGAVPGYGAEPGHDRIGIAERIAPFRWRLVMLHDGPEARIDLLELVPVPPLVIDPGVVAAR